MDVLHFLKENQFVRPVCLHTRSILEKRWENLSPLFLCEDGRGKVNQYTKLQAMTVCRQVSLKTAPVKLLVSCAFRTVFSFFLLHLNTYQEKNENERNKVPELELLLRKVYLPVPLVCIHQGTEFSGRPSRVPLLVHLWIWYGFDAVSVRWKNRYPSCCTCNLGRKYSTSWTLFL